MKQKLVLLCIAALFSISKCHSQTPVLTDTLAPNSVIKKHSVLQTFVLNNTTGKWEKQGKPFSMPDTATTAHAYKWKREKLVAVQNLQLIKGRWEKDGAEYPADTITKINLIIKNAS